MSDLQTYVGTIRVFANCTDELEATLTLDRLRTACEELLDEEDGDEVVVTQITPITIDVAPEEVFSILKRARNALIKTRMKECYNLAAELDKQIHALSYQGDPGYTPQYDYSRMLRLAEDILTNGKNPHD